MAANQRRSLSGTSMTYSAAAPRATLQLLIIALAAGVIVLLPSYYYRFRIFKGETSLTGHSANENRPEGAILDNRMNGKI
jgi:hypothetical protein